MNTNFFAGYCLSLFSVVNQFAIINIISELKQPTQPRISKVNFLWLKKIGYFQVGYIPPIGLFDAWDSRVRNLWLTYFRRYC
jgi:hypothetical protein